MSLKITQTFNYMKEPTFFHHLDPRTKGLAILLYSSLVFLVPHLLAQLLLTGFLFVFLAFSGILMRILEGLHALLGIFLLILIMNAYLLSINAGLLLVLRFLNLMVVFSVFFQTTQPDDLSQGLLRLKIPYAVAFSLSLAFRFIPTMALETETIVQAQKSRGHRFEEGGILQKIRNFFPLLIPLIMGSIRRAFHVAEALETRCFGITTNPNYYFPLKMNKRDWVFIGFLIISLICGIIFRVWSMRTLIPSQAMWDLPF